MSDLHDDARSFSLYVGADSIAINARAIKLGYLKSYALAVVLDAETYVPPPDLSEHFVTLKPEVGTVGSQTMSEEQALIAYHQALQETKGVIIYGPNGAGVWQLVFAVPMRIAPKLYIELDDPMLYVDEEDIARDPRAATVMVKFKVRNRTTRAVIKVPVAFRTIELNAEL